MKFKFTGEYEPMPFQDAIASKRKIEFEAESLGSILEQFEMFLRGCGYVFEGHIDIVDDFAKNHEYVDEDDLEEGEADNADEFEEDGDEDDDMPPPPKSARNAPPKSPAPKPRKK